MGLELLDAYAKTGQNDQLKDTIVEALLDKLSLVLAVFHVSNLWEPESGIANSFRELAGEMARRVSTLILS